MVVQWVLPTSAYTGCPGWTCSLASCSEYSSVRLFSFYTVWWMSASVISFFSFHAAISTLLISPADKWQWSSPENRNMMTPPMFLKTICFLLHTCKSDHVLTSSVEFMMFGPLMLCLLDFPSSYLSWHYCILFGKTVEEKCYKEWNSAHLHV